MTHNRNNLQNHSTRPTQPPSLCETVAPSAAASEIRHLLVLACSATKRTTTGLLPALERYDGNSYRVLAKFKRESDHAAAALARLDILILSAKYGWLLPTDPIENYDQLMSRARALEVQSGIGAYFDHWLETHPPYQEIYLNLGQTYRLALATSMYLSPALQTDQTQSQPPRGQTKIEATTTRLILAQGGIGQKAAQLKNWLYNLR